MKFTSKPLSLLTAFCALGITIAASSAPVQTSQRIETPLVGLFPLGDARYEKFNDYYLVRGRIFDTAFVQHIYSFDKDCGSATYETNKQYDVFEADIANNCSDTSDQIRFYVLGDVIYRSRRLTKQDKPVHIRIPIKSYRGITLFSQAYLYGGYPNVVWTGPKLVNFGRTPTQPVLLLQTSTAQPLKTFGQDVLTLHPRSDGSYQVTVNGKPVRFGSVQPVLKNGALLVPMRPLFEALGATVIFGSDSKTILATRGSREIRMQLGSTNAYLDGSPVRLDAPAQSLLGTTVVPLRFIAESFGTHISFSGTTP